MKKIYLYVLIAILLALLLLFIYKNPPIASTPGYSDKTPKTLAPMEAPTVTHGDTTVALIHIARTTSWSNQFVSGDGDQQGPMYAIPGVYLEFLVEQIGEVSAKSRLNGARITLLQGDRPISTSSPIVVGGDEVDANYFPKKERFGFKPPAVNDERKAWIRSHYLRGISLESGKVTINFEASFPGNDHLVMFAFKDIPLY